MKLLKVAALLCAASLSAFASTSSMTATVTDTDGQTWGACAWSAVLSSPVPPTMSGTPVSQDQLRASGTCSASGVITATLLDTSSIDQKGAVWVFKVAPNASGASATVSVAVTGASPNLTANFSSVPAPRFPAGPKAYGYADIEVTNPALGDTYVNTGTVCGAASLRQYSNAGWQCGGSGGGTDQTASSIGTLYGFGDSLVQGFAAPSSSVSMFGILSRDFPGSSANYAVGGTLMSSIANTVFLYLPPPFPGNPLPMVVQDGGTNDANTLGASTGSINNYKLEQAASIYWAGLPIANRFMASTATASGFAASYTGPGISGLNVGTGKQSTTSGDTLTFTGTSVGNKIGLTYVAFASNAGTFTVSLNGVLQTNVCSGTTTFSNSGCNGVAVSTNTFFRQEFTAVSGSAFTLVVTVTSSTGAGNIVSILDADTTPTSPDGLVPFIQSGVIRQYNDAKASDTDAFDAAASSVASQAKADNLNVFFADVRTGTPGVNATTDMAASTSACPATAGNTPLHPNQCGYLDYAATIENSAPKLFSAGVGARSGTFYTPFNIFTAYGTNVASALTNVNSNAVPVTGSLWGGGVQYWDINKGNIFMSGLVWDSAHSAVANGLASTANTALQHCSGVAAPSQCTNSLYLDANGNGTFKGSMQIGSTVAGTCAAALAGQFQYTHTDAATKDVVQVCAQDASGVYAWRTIY